MKYLLLIVLTASTLMSCITIYSHKKFTYKCDGRAIGIEKQLKINGYYFQTSAKGVSLIFIYADGSISSSWRFADLAKAEQYITTKRECMMCGFTSGQCRIFGDTLFVQEMYQKEATQYAIDIDTFIVKSDTSFEKVSAFSGKNGKFYLFKPFAFKPDSTLSSIRNHNWYWTKRYKDSVYHRGAYKHTR